ncbi:MAG TPA: right-handed parallel beta-helix repeat-containing protein [Usitatibacter sp.]|nr:right-handed parallel beta-helix repeat-containing protein [Usitatibacter sp.]
MIRFVARVLPVLVSFLVLCAPAHAQLFRAYVASYGLDTNPCAVTAPCRLLPAALDAVRDGGEIWMLDSANFNQGTVTINKNVTILAIPGQVGSISSVGGAEAINIPNASTVRFRNVVVADNANNHGTYGIVAPASARIVVEKSTFAVVTHGIFATGGYVDVHDTTFTGGAGGIYAKGGARVDVWHCRFSGMHDYGVRLDGSGGSATLATVSDSSFADGWGGVGSFGTADVTATLRASVARSTLSNLNWGVVNEAVGSNQTIVTTVGSSAFSQIFNSAFSATGAGAENETIGNNQVRQVGAPNVGPFTPVGSM